MSYGLGLAIAALALFRRRSPLLVLLASLVLLTAYYFLDYPGISAAIPLSVALATSMPGRVVVLGTCSGSVGELETPLG